MAKYKYVEDVVNAANSLDSAVDSMDGFVRANKEVLSEASKKKIEFALDTVRTLAVALYAEAEEWGRANQEPESPYVGRRVRLLKKDWHPRHDTIGAVIISDPPKGETRFRTDAGEEVGAYEYHYSMESA